MTNKMVDPSRLDAAARRWMVSVAWVLIVLAYLAFLVIELRLDYNQILEPCTGTGCNWAAISQAEFDALRDFGLPDRSYADVTIGGMIITAALYSLMGALIFWREGRTRIGFFVSLLLIIMPIASYADADNVVANYPALGVPAILLSVMGTWLQFILIYLFPNGRFYPRWAPVPLVLTIIYLTLSLLSYGGFLDLGQFSWIASDFILFLLLIGVAVILQFARYFKAATPEEKLQTRWVLFGFVFYFLGPFIWYALYGGDIVFTPGLPRLLVTVFGWALLQAAQLAFLSTVAIAILRFRLWNIDLIIRRTLVYGSLTGTLALLYFGTIVIFQSAFGSLTGETNSPLVTVVSTLVIAALFNPLRVRLQAFIDRRFYRHKYNAEQSVSRFAASARDEVDMHRLALAVLATVDETVQPSHASLWINLS